MAANARSIEVHTNSTGRSHLRRIFAGSVSSPEPGHSGDRGPRHRTRSRTAFGLDCLNEILLLVLIVLTASAVVGCTLPEYMQDPDAEPTDRYSLWDSDDESVPPRRQSAESDVWRRRDAVDVPR